MSRPINRRYHARNVVQLGGRRLQGWTPRMVAMLAKQQRQEVGKGEGDGTRSAPPAKVTRRERPQQSRR